MLSDPPGTTRNKDKVLGRLLPLSPVCRVQVVDPFFRFRVDPTAENAANRKRKSACAIIFDDGDFKVAVEWRGGDRLPLHVEIMGTAKTAALI